MIIPSTLHSLSFLCVVTCEELKTFLKVAATGKKANIAVGVFTSTNKLYSSEGDWSM